MKRKVLYVIDNPTTQFGEIVPKDSVILDSSSNNLYKSTSKLLPNNTLGDGNIAGIAAPDSWNVVEVGFTKPDDTPIVNYEQNQNYFSELAIIPPINLPNELVEGIFFVKTVLNNTSGQSLGMAYAISSGINNVFLFSVGLANSNLPFFQRPYRTYYTSGEQTEITGIPFVTKRDNNNSIVYKFGLNIGSTLYLDGNSVTSIPRSRLDFKIQLLYRLKR
ncbi:MAG: hypothetical protein KDD00_17130 [Ignavibacteriae bacterium]|nr:hypothetical protein [Ignavibacteriota bacterium]